MAADAVEITTELPPAYWPELTIRFFPEYSSKHPLWIWFGYPDLTELQLPAERAGRLQRWATYWDSTFHWDDGWPAGTPEPWWAEEEDLLPRHVAIALGSDFVIEADGHYLHSTTDAGSPASTAALHALIDAEINERERTRAVIAAGARYDALASDTSSATWLAERHRNEPPSQ